MGSLVSGLAERALKGKSEQYFRLGSDSDSDLSRI